MPMCEANSLDMGLSPKKARIQGTTSMNSCAIGSQTRMPVLRAALHIDSQYLNHPVMCVAAYGTYHNWFTNSSIISSGDARFDVAR